MSLIGSLLLKAHQQKARRIGVVSWEGGKSVHRGALALTVALSQQSDRRCALVVSEGVRFQCENHEGFAKVTLPEVLLPEVAEGMERSLDELDRTFPFQVVVGSPVSQWNGKPGKAADGSAPKAQTHVLMVPSSGLSRSATRKIEAYARANRIQWIGIIPIEEDHSHA